MTHAYDEQYLSDAMNNLGEMMDYAVNTCHFEINEFFEMFLVSGLAVQFAKGAPKVVSGMSGVELAMEVVRKSGADMELPDAEAEYDRSPEYWCGWIAAFYQWYTGVPFRELSQIVSGRCIQPFMKRRNLNLWIMLIRLPAGKNCLQSCGCCGMHAAIPKKSWQKNRE